MAQLGEIIMLIARMSAAVVRLTGGRMSRISEEEVEVADRRDRSPVFGDDIFDNFPVLLLMGLRMTDPMHYFFASHRL